MQLLAENGSINPKSQGQLLPFFILSIRFVPFVSHSVQLFAFKLQLKH
jgi:hypothetical protein